MKSSSREDGTQQLDKRTSNQQQSTSKQRREGKTHKHTTQFTLCLSGLAEPAKLPFLLLHQLSQCHPLVFKMHAVHAFRQQRKQRVTREEEGTIDNRHLPQNISTLRRDQRSTKEDRRGEREDKTRTRRQERRRMSNKPLKSKSKEEEEGH